MLNCEFLLLLHILKIKDPAAWSFVDLSYMINHSWHGIRRVIGARVNEVNLVNQAWSHGGVGQFLHVRRWVISGSFHTAPDTNSDPCLNFQAWWKRRSTECGVRSAEYGVRSLSKNCLFRLDSETSRFPLYGGIKRAPHKVENAESVFWPSR
jgi:hypothetical protein